MEIEAATGVTPKALLSRPNLRADCQGYLDAFFFMSDAREYNQAGLQPLRFTEIQAYLALSGISGEERKAKLLRMIRALDDAFMQHHFDKQKEKQPTG